MATTNGNKIQEFKRMLKPTNLNIIALSELNFNDPIKETGNSFEENAFIKAITVFKKYKKPTLADDSGLTIDILSGFPGIYSARFCGENMTFKEKREKILKIMSKFKGKNRTARFVCSLCMVLNDENTDSFETAKKQRNIIFATGEYIGQISEKITNFNSNGFGYDPIFLYKEGKTFADLTSQEKDNISHRHKALIKLQKILQERNFYT